MTRLQKLSCVILSICFFAVLAAKPGPFFMRGNVYRQLPLYCFLEQKARRVPLREDPETYKILQENKGEYLARLIEEENLKENEQHLSFALSGEQVQSPEATPVPDTAQPLEATQLPEAAKSPEATRIPEAAKSSEATQPPKATQTPKPTQIPDASSDKEEAATVLAQLRPRPVIDLSLERLGDYDYLLNHFFIVDANTATNADQLNAARFLEKDLSIKKNEEVPQILIYHSHTQEAFADSREGKVEDTIVGVGNYLTKLLTETYGYQVIHVTEEFDLAGGSLDRSKAYDYARPYIEEILQKNPSVEVVIDLHRDGVPEDRRLVTEINGKPTAQIMFYNGLSYTLSGGQVDYLPNPYIQDNLSFSFQMEYQAAQYYPEFYRGIYLSGLRYNLHLCPKSVLLEAGAQTNTVQEVKNAMEPFADILNRVLSGE